jgi:predicted NUDIX family phosphoesterase
MGYFDFSKIIKENFEYRERSDVLENDPEFIQIIPYIWLINPKTKKAFIYQRALGKGEYSDKRYINKLTGGVGGHIDRDTEQDSDDPVMDALLRELKEELLMKEYPQPEFFGYIKDNSDMFNKVHLGFVGKAETTQDAIPADGMKKGSFYTVEEIEKMFSDSNNQIEAWTKITWPFIKEYILSL